MLTTDFVTAVEVRSLLVGSTCGFALRFAGFFTVGLVLSLPFDLWMDHGLDTTFATACLAAFLTVKTHKLTPFLSRGRFIYAVLIAHALTFFASLVFVSSGFQVSFWTATSRVATVWIAVAIVYTFGFLRVCLRTPGAT